ncbi:MAG TPA: alpha/beta hydrolase [Pyrinomonadaceae bacterium]|nr:alpha/beta hydrolase [Pyrinomonadaceae bacterium]
MNFRHSLRSVALVVAVMFSAAVGASAQEKTKAGGKQDADGSRFAVLDGARVHYKSLGKGKEAIVFVHGWTCNLDFWRMQTPAFAARTRVIALDLPGHGRSDKPERVAYTMDLFARSVEAVMRDAGVRRAVLVGHSMGTPVVRQFYRRYPEKTLALVFVDGGLRPFAPRSVLEGFMASLRADYKTASGQMVEGMLQPVKSDAVRAEIRAAMLSTPPHVGVGAMEGMMDEANWKEDAIRVPVLSIHARSPFWPADYEEFLRRLAPDLDFQMWDGVSHFLMMDDPERFNRALAAFLDARKLPGRAKK